MTPDYGSHTEHDAAAYERAHACDWRDYPDERELAEMRAEWEADNRAAVKRAQDEMRGRVA